MNALPQNGHHGPSKDEAAKTLAESHYRVDPSISHIFRVTSANEASPSEPIKLLEVSSQAVPSGILPIRFGPHAPSGVPFPSIIIEVHPSEWEQIHSGKLQLPNGWKPVNTPYQK